MCRVLVRLFVSVCSLSVAGSVAVTSHRKKIRFILFKKKGVWIGVSFSFTIAYLGWMSKVILSSIGGS